MTRPSAWLRVAPWCFALYACAGSNEAVDGGEAVASIEVESPVVDGGVADASSDAADALDAFPSDESRTPFADATEDRGGSGSVLTTIESSWDECEGAAVSLDISGTTPLGVFHVLQAVVAYVDTLAFSTTLEFRGSVGGRKARILVSVLDEDLIGPASVGTYIAAAAEHDAGAPVALLDDGTVLVHADGSSSGVSNYLAATIEIDEHDFHATASGNNVPTRLRGTVEVNEPGWSLRIPFDFDYACNYTINAI